MQKYWSVAWRAAVAVAVFVLIAETAFLYGYKRGEQVGFAIGVSRCVRVLPNMAQEGMHFETLMDTRYAGQGGS